jgi:hypothetical protein
VQLTDTEKALVEKHRVEQKRNAFQAAQYTDAQKVAEFDKLYKLASDHLKEVKTDGRTKDIEHWCYEAVIGLLGKGVWDVINSHAS